MDGDEAPTLKPLDAAAPLGGGGEQQQYQDGSQPSSLLPDDVLANIFSRLAPRWIAGSRCVCTSWRASIDARRLLRADLLPLSLRGILVHFDVHKFPAFFSCPALPDANALTGKLSFLPFANPADCAWRVGEAYKIWEKYAIKNHCNGLLLIDKYVVNPATRRWDALPPGPPGRVQFLISSVGDPEQTMLYETIHDYLVFDPTVSAHYQVLRICALSRMGSMHDLWKKDAQCPSSSCTLNVLSSRTGCWEERCFVREGAAAGTVAEVESRPRSGAVYWRGALYVHCESHFVLRISLSSNTYRVIKPPPGYGGNSYPVPHLQKSEKGVYFVALDNYLLQVWILQESSGQMEWVLKHDRDMEPVLARHCRRQVRGTWMLKGTNHNSFCTHFPEGDKEDIVEEKFEWCSDSDDDVPEYEDMPQECSSEECYSNNNSDDVLDNEDVMEECSSEANEKSSLEENFESSSNDGMVEECYSDEEDICEIDMLGLHPYKEVLFLCESAKTGLAYHLSSSKIEDLGDIYPTNYHRSGGYGMDMVQYAFMYTPCWMEEFPRNI
uniref:Uncharacterized protein n=2 Tax=Avena sativa TaxID=4498 RepID=A0ACD5VP00_AVESA